MDIEQQKQLADDILLRLLPVDPFAIVAGGASRDWYLGNPANDLDIYLHVGKHYTRDLIHQILEHIGMNVSKEKTKEDVSDHYEKNCNLEAVYDIGGLDMPVQLMLMSEPTFKCVVPQFPLSLCQAWYKNGKVSVGKDFLISLRHKVLYKTNQVYGDESRYIKKICKRFSDYRYFPSKEACLEWVVLNSGENNV